MTSLRHSPPRALNMIAGGLLGLALILLIRRYVGINHDSSLYLGQALMQRWPEIFGSDLFFAHGSQGSYTLLPFLVSRAFDFFDPPAIFLVGSLLGLFLFGIASWYVLSAILPAQQRYWALLGILGLPSLYGVIRIFSYNEPFLTSRALSEGFSLLGIGLLVRGRWSLATVAVVLAGMLHPLQAITVALVVWPWAVMQDRRWLHAIWLGIPLALLGLTDIRPFNDLYRQVDSAWLADLRQFTSQLFVTRWNWNDFNNLGLDVLVLAYAWRTLPDAFGKWCAAALCGLLLGISASLVLVDWLQLALPAGLQLWRVHWLAHWFSMASIGALLFRDVRAGEVSRALCLGLTGLLAWGVPVWWTWLPFALLYGFWHRLSGASASRMKTMLGFLSLSGMLLLLGIYIANEWLPFRMAHYRLELYAIDRRILAFPLVAMGLSALAVLLWERLGRTGRWLLVFGVLCPLAALGAARWDARPPIALAIENNPYRPDLFGPELPLHAQVYWDGDIYAGTWLSLHRADYFNLRQLAGLVFNRGTAKEAHERLSRILPLYRESLYCQTLTLEKREHCQISDQNMRIACSPGPIRRPDYLVLPYRQSQRASGSWAIIDPATGEPAVTYWLYACSGIMQDLQGRSATSTPTTD